MSTNQGTASDVDVDLARLFSSLKRDWQLILGVALLVAGLAFIYTLVATPTYVGETRILIETRESEFTRRDANDLRAPAILDEEGVTSQVQVILSNDLLRGVVNDLDLTGREEFAGQDVSVLGRLLVLVGLRSNPSELAREQRVMRAFREKLNVFRVERSRVIVIEFRSEDPELAAAVPNALADAYISTQSEAKLQSNVAATDWLEPEIADLRDRVRTAEGRVAEYRARSGLLVGGNNSMLATQQLSEISSELSRVRANRSAAEANAQSMRAALQGGTSLDSIPEVLNSGLIQRLREREVELRAEIADLSTTLLDNHPRLRSLRSQLADLETQARAEARKVLAGLETEASNAQAREQSLFAELNGLKAASAQADEDGVELRALEREATAQRELLESYLTRFREASSRGERNYLPADARIFSRATVPSQPAFPRTLPIVGSAFAGALLLMVIATLLRELFSGRAMMPARREHFEADDMAVPATATWRAPAVDVHEPFPVATIAEPVSETVTVAERPPVEDVKVSRAETAETKSPSLASRIAGAAFFGRRRAEPETGVEEPGRNVPVVEAPAAAPSAAASMEADDASQAVPFTIGELGVDVAAERLIVSGVARAIVVSPEGDEAAAASVLLAREVADAGMRTILIDLTATGAASRPMLESSAFQGITNLLASEAQFSDVIHGDVYSDAHVIPIGTANPAKAMRAIERLPIILESLSNAYDIVLVECGAADADAVRRLVDDSTEIMVSAIYPGDVILDAAEELVRGGLRQPMIVSPDADAEPYGSGRYSAA